MTHRFMSLLVFCAFFSSIAVAQRADLAGIKICIDPGHGGNNAANDRHLIPDPGTDFWESESNFQKALLLKALLEAKGATVLLTRNTNTYPTDAEPSLATRVAFANANNVNWFHSIHSNATGLASNTSINYTLMLVREEIVPGGSSVYGPGTGKPEKQGAWDISLIIGPYIKEKLRTQRTSQYLDWTFYGGTNGGFTLGVLRGLSMPGQLSEGSMHDYYPETRRLMNNSYRKMEAYAIRDAFLSYFGVPADSPCIVAGIISEIGTGKLIDAARVRLLPENLIYTGDQYRNGFYMFDGIQPGPHTIRFETPGYRPDSAQIMLTAGETRFLDRQLEFISSPMVVTSTPGRSETEFSAAGQIQITFSKIMDTLSVRNAFTLIPAVKGNLLWSNGLMTVTFKTDSIVLPFNTSFVLRVEGTARSMGGFFIDGNGDGIPGDAFQLSFTTKPADVWHPILTSAFTPNGSLFVSPSSMINFTYDEPLDPASVNTSNIVIQEVGGPILPRTFEYQESNGRGGFNIYPQGGLGPGKSYRIRISGVTDLSGNAIPASNPLWSFSVAPSSGQITTIENFGSSVASWWQPATNASTVGVDSATFEPDSAVTLKLFGSGGPSAKLKYTWRTSAPDWLLRVSLRNPELNQTYWSARGTALQLYVYGDGSGNFFRFEIEDSVEVFPEGRPENREVGPWTKIDWVGWKLVSWDFKEENSGSWTGSGKLEGTLRFSGFQLKYDPLAGSRSGTVYVDQLQLSKGSDTVGARPPGSIALSFSMSQNYPNPFNAGTRIDYVLEERVDVSLRVYDILGRQIRELVSSPQSRGGYQVYWDGKNDQGDVASSGVYLYQLRTGAHVSTRKMVFVK
ncbi:MAG TPA: hypothetical protein DEP53_09060 [Bacteroidetes bacterium]|nr:hypothetical protein [Bacteroidota bacterium]